MERYYLNAVSTNGKRTAKTFNAEISRIQVLTAMVFITFKLPNGDYYYVDSLLDGFYLRQIEYGVGIKAYMLHYQDI